MSRTLRFLVATSLTTALACAAVASPTPDAAVLHARVRVLADDAMGGRGNGCPELAAAADTLVGWFAASGLEPRDGEDFRERFMLDLEGGDVAEAANVVGVAPGRGALADRTVIVGAHYDHLGRRLEDDGSVSGIYNGAEDNASGVAVLCELARLLREDDAPSRRTVVFAAFAGEEIGLQGARAFVDRGDGATAGVDLMLNLDSVGRLRERRLYVGGVGSAGGLRDLVEDVNTGHGLDLQLSEGGWDASDHVAFNAAGVPVLFLFTGPHPQYHSVDDTADLVEPAGLATVAAFAWDVLDRAVRRDGPFVYRRVAEVSALDSDRGKERAWLGTIPDFDESVAGVRLSGVMPGSPAEETGLVAGDVVTGLGETEVTSLQDLTVALRTHGAGTMVDVRFERGGEMRVVPVTLRTRPR